MTDYLIRWYDNGDEFEKATEDVVNERLQRLAESGVRGLELYSRVPLEVTTHVRIVKRIRKNSLTAGSSVGSPPRTMIAGSVVGDVRSEGQLFKEGPREAGSPVDSGTLQGEAVLETASDRRESTEENRAPSCGDASDREKDGAPEPESAPAFANPNERKEQPDQAVNVAVQGRVEEAGPLDLPKGETAAETDQRASKESPLIVGAAVQPPLPHSPSWKCNAPDCPVIANGEGIENLCGMHAGVEQSIKREWYFARHPELKKSRRKKSEAANG